MDKLFGKKILDYKEDILRDLAELMSIPSVPDLEKATKDAPYGEEAKKALDWTLNRAEELGFSTTNVKNKAGHVSYGEGEDVVAVASHVDVVPAGEGWEQDNPYELTEKNNTYYGRGIIDDKGPAIISLYCLKALKDAGIVGNHELRAIFGSGEEINSDDLDVYFSKEKAPLMSFTPDADYGICIAEKGLQRIAFSGSPKENGIVKKFVGGTVVNAIPNKATAVVECSEEEYQNVLKVSDKTPCKYDFDYKDNELTIISHGTSAHVSLLESCTNAITYMIKLLVDSFGEEKVGSLIYFLNKYIGLTYNGELFGIDFEDDVSGKLILALTIINIDDNIAEAQCDIRFPVKFKKEQILDKINNIMDKCDINIKDCGSSAPLYVPQDMPLIPILQNAYKNITGEDASLYSTSAGSYARELKGTGVAFGPKFDDDVVRIHDVGENFPVDNFWLNAQICLQATYEMFISE